MTKAEIVRKMAETTDLTIPQADLAVDAFFDCMAMCLKENGVFNYNGYIRAQVVTREAHTARNPRTGEAVEVAEYQTVRVKPGVRLVDFIQGKQSVSSKLGYAVAKKEKQDARKEKLKELAKQKKKDKAAAEKAEREAAKKNKGKGKK